MDSANLENLIAIENFLWYTVSVLIAKLNFSKSLIFPCASTTAGWYVKFQWPPVVTVSMELTSVHEVTLISTKSHDNSL